MRPAINWFQTVGSLERKHPPWVLRRQGTDFADFPVLHQGIEGAERLLDRSDGIVGVDLIQVDVVALQPVEAGFDAIHDVAAQARKLNCFISLFAVAISALGPVDKSPCHFRPPSAVRGKAVKSSRRKSPRRTQPDVAVAPIRRHNALPEGRTHDRRLNAERAATQPTIIQIYI